MSIDATTWAALAFVLTALGGAATYVAWRQRGTTAGLRGLAWTLVPVALWLTGTLRLAGNVAGDVADWASALVFSPRVWAGIVVAGISAVLFGTTTALRARAAGRAPAAGKTKQVEARKTSDDPVLEGLDPDVAAILKRRGIQ